MVLMVESQEEILKALHTSVAKVMYRETKGQNGTQVSMVLNTSPEALGFKAFYRKRADDLAELEIIQEAIRGKEVIRVGEHVEIGELFG